MKKTIGLFLILVLAASSFADICRDEFDLNDYLVIAVTSSRFSTGALYTAGDTAVFNIWKVEAGTPNVEQVAADQGMTENFDSKTGLVVGTIQLSTGNGFAAGGDYFVLVTATVDSVAGGVSDTFHIRAAPLATAAALSTASGYASDAKTAAEKIDTSTELRTLLYGSDTAGATATALSTASGYASDAKTAAEKIDTATELRTLMYGSDTAGATAAGLGSVTLANGAHGGAAATLTLSDYSNFKATGFALASAWSADLATGLGTAAGYINDGESGMPAIFSYVSANSAAIGHETYGLSAIRTRGDSAWITATGFATSTALATAQTDLDTITGSDGVTLATAQANYAPAKAGDAMDLIDNAVDAGALATTAVAELWAQALSDLAAGAPAANASVLTAINYMYEVWRNKTTTTATSITVYKDDGTTALATSTISDDGTTFTKGEYGAP